MTHKIQATCPYCQASFEADIHLQVDVVASPELKQSLLAHELNQCECPRCRQLWTFIAPCVYWDKNWIGVVLATLAEPPLLAKEAVAETNHLLKRTRPARQDLPTKVLVMGTLDELIYTLEDPYCRAYVKPLSDMLLRNWTEAKDGLTALSDAFLKADLPQFAFWVLGDTLAYLPELYFIPSIREALELTALAAGDGLLPNQTNQKTASVQLKLLEEFATELKPKVLGDMDPLEHFELIYYKPIPDPKVSTQTVLTNEGIIYQSEPSNFEKALARMFVILWAGEAERFLPAADPEVDFFGRSAIGQFSLHWPELSGEEQLELDRLYTSLTGAGISTALQLRLKYFLRKHDRPTPEREPTWFKVVSSIPGGGSIYVKCSTCGYETDFEPRSGEEPPARCPGCGSQ